MKQVLSLITLATLLAPALVIAQESAPPPDLVIATYGKAKNNGVKLFDRQGTLAASFQISKKQGSDYLAGNWNGLGNAPAALARTGKRISLRFFDRTGAVLGTLAPTPPIASIAALVAGDLDGSGVDDLAVIKIDGDTIVHLDPGLSSTATHTLKLPKAEHYSIAGSRQRVLGIASYSSPTRALTVTALDGTVIAAAKLSVRAEGKLLPLSVDNDGLTIAVAEDEEVNLFNATGERIRSIPMSSRTTALSGDYTGNAGPFGEFIEASHAGTFTFLDPATNATSLANFSVLDPDDGPRCDLDSVQGLLDEMAKALASGDYKKVAQISKKLAKAKLDPDCLKAPDFSSTIGNTLSRIETIEFASSSVAVDGGAALACDEFLPSRDGAKRGFILKNGDSTGRIVAVLPGDTPPLESVNVLGSNYQQIDSLRYAGLGNPEPASFQMRQHWRGNRSLAGYPGTIVIQGVGGTKKYCWIVKKGRSTRID